MNAVLNALLQLILVVATAPLLTGLVRLTKSRLQGRRGAPPWQPYREVWRLLGQESVIADSATWLFPRVPYLVFTLIWLAATIMPTFSTDLAVAPAGDIIVLVALLGSARFFLALAGLDAGTPFGGLGASREMYIASIGEPAMLMVAFTFSLVTHTTAPAQIAAFVLDGHVGLQVSLGLALGSLLIVALAENGRLPIDNPATHLELTMVHEAMVLEYSGRHLALLDLAAMMRLQLFVSIIIGLFCPWGIGRPGGGTADALIGLLAWGGKAALLAIGLGLFESLLAKMRLFRIADLLAGALLLALLATIFLYVSEAV